MIVLLFLSFMFKKFIDYITCLLTDSIYDSIPDEKIFF